MGSKFSIVSARRNIKGNHLSRLDINYPAMKPIQRLFLILVCLLSFSASAQWAWVDKDGKKVFSDLAPTADVPDKSIFKRPGRNVMAVAPAASDNATTEKTPTAAHAGASKPVTGVDKDLAARLKKTEQEQAIKKKADEERISKVKADNCARAKLAQKSLDSGVRVSRVNAQGEREILDDAARSAETKRLQGIVQSECL